MSEQKEVRLKVRALRQGFFNGILVQIDGIIYLSNKEEFSYRWMDAIGWTPPGRKELGASRRVETVLKPGDIGFDNDDIVKALDKLDHADDTHWTVKGLPNMEVVKKLMGTVDVTRKNVEAALEGFTREMASGSDDGEGSGSGGDENES